MQIPNIVTEAGPSAFATIHENYYYVFVVCSAFFLVIAYFFFPYVFPSLYFPYYRLTGRDETHLLKSYTSV
jgi:hypothetical protein